MKPTKHVVTLILLCMSCFAYAQQVSIDNSIPLQQLIENHLANSCVEITNVTSTINGSVDGFTSYGAFQRGSSNFPLENGIVLSSGNAASGGNTTNNTDLSEGTTNWGTDPDIETYLGVGNTVNATSIEFDFVALSDRIQFNYILASEEYFANYPCNSSDGFVFLIRQASSTGSYDNIALVPGSGDQVTVNNIHDEILTQCVAANDQYFDGYAFGDTNYNGRTNVLTAGYNVVPNTQYHVKLIIADQSRNGIDPAIDSSVFIEANTFTELELGDDIDTCSGSVTLNGEIQNPLATYAWFRNNTLISGENNSTLTTTLSGLYRVEVSINSCVIQDEVNVNIDTELTANPISAFELCDTDSNGQETFDLSNKDIDVINAIQNLPQNYTISYYLTDNDARNNPSNNITSPISSTSQTIYVRVEDTVNGCVIYGNFELIVNPLPPINQPTDLDVCDNDNVPDNITQIDLSQKNSEITGGNPNNFVTYHYTLPDANSGNNPITLPYTNTNPTETLYVRVVNSLTGCVNSSGVSLTINVTNGNTQINRDTQYIDACDADHDGSATFDITQVFNDILNGATGFLPPTYHTSYADAESGSNPISNPQNYVNTNPEEQIIYLRLEDSSTGCYAIVPIEIHTNLLLTATNIPANGFAFCDQDGDGSVDVYLNTIENVIANGLPNVGVTFYATQNDRDSGSSPLNTSNPLTIVDGSPTTLYITIDNGSCSEVSEILLRVNPVVTFAPVEPIPYCDNDDDGTTTIDFESFDDTITGGNTNFSVRYFTDANDADTGVNELPRFYTSGSNTFFARIENANTGCYTVNQFDVDVIPAPSVMQPSDIIICNNNTNTSANIRLEDKISEIVSDTSNLVIEFFEDLNQAQSFDSTNPVGNLNKQSFDASTQTIYVRVEETNATACYNLVSFNVIVNTIPIIPSIAPYQVCVDPGTSDADFYLQDKDAEILNGQFGKEVYYFEDAAYTIPIDKTLPYNSNGAQTIYVRVENFSDPNCFDTSSFILEIGTNPNYNTNFTDFPPVCQSTAGTHTFDLDAKRQEIATGSTDSLDIQFYLAFNEADTDSSNFLPDQYTSQDLQGQFYARIENSANSCYVIEEVRFITFPTPLISSATIAPVCDTDYDGNTTIDLTTATYQIENVRFGDVTLTYFEDDALNVQISSTQLNNYPITNSKTIYVRAETSTGCSSSIPLDLLVNLPPTILNVGTIQDCDNVSGFYDLSQVDTFVVHNSIINTVNISYHDSQTNAENNTGVYTNDAFNYTSSGNYPIYVRVEDINTGCLIYTSFNLQISPNPVANTPPNMEECDDDYDNFFVFSLDEQTPYILGNQNPNDFTVTYYTSLDNAEAGNNSLPLSHSATHSEVIYARIENNLTGCYSTAQFTTLIQPLPIINIEDIEPLCTNDLPLTLDAETGNIGDQYLWSTGETTPQIQLGLADIGDYWITITTPFGCEVTKPFSVIASEEATINFTTTVDFADPNSITVEVSGNGDYVFMLDHGPAQESNVFNNVSLGLHLVTVRDLNGCTDVEQEVVVIDVPKFMTPNNDGYFDTWHIVGIEQLPGTIVYIYDRHGKLLKTLPHTSHGWDGTFNGNLMPSNDYWFLAEVQKDGEAFEVKGHFTLKR